MSPQIISCLKYFLKVVQAASSISFIEATSKFLFGYFFPQKIKITSKTPDQDLPQPEKREIVEKFLHNYLNPYKHVIDAMPSSGLIFIILTPWFKPA